MTKRYERPEVKQISKQWVSENCRNITIRDLGLIKAIHRRRLVRRDQIEFLFPEFPSTDFLNKRLTTLYKKHVIDRIYPPVGLGEGSAKQHICLDRAGAILLGLEKYNKPITTDQNGNKALPLGWGHKIMLNQYECWIRESANLLGAQVKYYAIEEPCEFGSTVLKPDIACLISCGGKGYVFFIEVDLGTEDIPYVKKKIDTYIDYYMSKQWLKEPWARVFKVPSFPRVLFLTENGRTKRQATLQEYTEESSVRFTFDFHENFMSILKSIIKGSH